MTSTLTIRSQSVCSGGEHMTVRWTVNGGVAKTMQVEVAQLLVSLTLEQEKDVVIRLLQLHFQGEARTKLNTDMQVGISLVI